MYNRQNSEMRYEELNTEPKETKEHVNQATSSDAKDQENFNNLKEENELEDSLANFNNLVDYDPYKNSLQNSINVVDDNQEESPNKNHVNDEEDNFIEVNANTDYLNENVYVKKNIKKDSEKNYFDRTEDEESKDEILKIPNIQNSLSKIREQEKIQTKANFFKDDEEEEIMIKKSSHFHVIQPIENTKYNRGLTMQNNNINNFYEKFKKLDLLDSNIVSNIQPIDVKRKHTDYDKKQIFRNIEQSTNSNFNIDIESNENSKLKHFQKSINSGTEETIFEEDNVLNELENFRIIALNK